MNFFERLEKRAKEIDSLLCIGLDPRVPDSVDKDHITTWIVEQNMAIIEASSSICLAYKPNIAFYEAYGEAGLLALKSTLALIPNDIPVILDAKRADIGATSEAYAQAAFDWLSCDAITVAPYMGFDSVEPFTTNPEKGVFVLCKTSNAGASDFQSLEIKGQKLFELVAEKALSWSNNIGLVVAANDGPALRKIRSANASAWFLAPGIGTQGGSISEAVDHGLRNDGMGILLVIARSFVQAKDMKLEATRLVNEFREAKKAKLQKIRQNIDIQDDFKNQVLQGLIKTKCFKTGSFVLKSGISSPFYVDLRRVMSDSQVMTLVGRAYGKLIEACMKETGIRFDRIAGIPVAALPLATAASLETGIPMIFPRLQQKEHGTGNMVEGEFNAGERVILLDDLITTGKSKIEALDILRKEGLKVDHLVVLLERGAQGRADMTSAGVKLYSFAHIGEFFPVIKELGLINDTMLQELYDFLAKNGG